MTDLIHNFLFMNFVVGVLLAVCTALLSPILVSKQMSNLSNGMAHATLGGLAIALLLIPSTTISTSHLIIAMVFISICALVISLRSEKEERDSSIAVLFAGAMALGPFLNSLSQQKFDYSSFLFGNLLLTDESDLKLIIPVLILSLASILYFRKVLLYWIFDEHFLYFKSRRYRLVPVLFVTICSLTIVLATKITGIILMTTMLVVPGILSLRLKKTLLPTLGISIVIGLVSYILGFFLSYQANVPIGSTIALVQVMFYFLPFRSRLS